VTGPIVTARGRFITLEGGEGGGKSTQLRRLARFLRGQGLDVVETREPGGAAGAEAIRPLLTQGDVARWDVLSETLLLAAARRNHVEQTIRPALDAGRWVISDRFIDSTRAYQGGARGLDPAVIATLEDWVLDGLMPDLTVILDLPPETGLIRAGRRIETAAPAAPGAGEDRFERMGLDFHQALRTAFLAIATAEPARCAVVDATADVDTVETAIRDIVTGRLAPGRDVPA
jgi:dTMP kinase